MSKDHKLPPQSRISRSVHSFEKIYLPYVVHYRFKVSFDSICSIGFVTGTIYGTTDTPELILDQAFEHFLLDMVKIHPVVGSQGHISFVGVSDNFQQLGVEK